MADEYHTQVRVVVEQLDENGDVAEVLSEKVVADFPNDQDDEYAGEKSDVFFTRLCREADQITI